MQVSATSAEAISTGVLREDPAKLDDAARQFEALLISGMLKSARESGGEGFMGSGTDGASDTALSMADEQLAQAMASRGGLGLAKLISERLATANNTTPSSQANTTATERTQRIAEQPRSVSAIPVAGVSGEAETQISTVRLLAKVPETVSLSLDPNPFNPTGGMHYRPESQTSQTSTVPGTAPGSYGVAVAGPSQSYLPFDITYLTGVDANGYHYLADYVDYKTACEIARYTGIDGATVVIGCRGGFLDQKFVGSYGIQFPSGQVLDAGLLADMYRRYPKDYAGVRLQQELEKCRSQGLGTTFYSVDDQGAPLYSIQYLAASEQDGTSSSQSGNDTKRA